MVKVDYKELQTYCSKVLQGFGLKSSEADIASEVLVQADLRNIPSHGVARLSMYTSSIEAGFTKTDGEIDIIRETPNTITVDGKGKIGAAVSCEVMKKVIEKADKFGIGIGCVKNSNHYGIAGYYAMMGLDKGMIGMSLTNSAPLGIPTFGTKVKFGSNPIAFAAPGNKEKAFVLDMSTTVITRGKVEVYERENKSLPDNWTVDSKGQVTNNPGKLLQDMVSGIGGGILPLGGEGEFNGGHKGYGLGMMVDILTGVLAGSDFSDKIQDTLCATARVSHFFMAIKIENFRDLEQFKSDMDELLIGLKTMTPAEGQDRVFYAGEKEFEAEGINKVNGIELLDIVYDEICNLGKKVGLPPLGEKSK